MNPTKGFTTHRVSKFVSDDHEGGRGPTRLFVLRVLRTCNITGHTSYGYHRMGTADCNETNQ